MPFLVVLVASIADDMDTAGKVYIMVMTPSVSNLSLRLRLLISSSLMRRTSWRIASSAFANDQQIAVAHFIATKIPRLI
jgi:hypothetical protein